MIAVIGEIAGSSGIAPIAEGALAVLQRDEVEAGRLAGDPAYRIGTDAGLLDEGEHF